MQSLLENLLAFLLDHHYPVPREEIFLGVADYRRDWVAGDDTARESVRRKFERDKNDLKALGITLQPVGKRYSEHAGQEVDTYALKPKDFYLPYLEIGGKVRSGRKPYGLPTLTLKSDEFTLLRRAAERVQALEGTVLGASAASALRKLSFDLPELEPDATDLTLHQPARAFSRQPGHFPRKCLRHAPQYSPHCATRSRLAASAFTIASIMYLLISFFVRERDKLAAAVTEQNKLLRIEQDKSESLLLNILPAPIARRLKEQQGMIADGFADVTVMFADIINFTRLAEEVPPKAMVELLNEVFSKFDAMAEFYRLEKIKTIGDAYMVAGGLIEHDGVDFSVDARDYTGAMLRLALEIRDYMEVLSAQKGMSLEIHIGICSGPVVAGVIGTRKFIHDM